jgi:hypothetical protein
MTDTATLIARSRTEMIPLPIVVDADVLHRNVDYCLRTGFTPRLLESASRGYTLITGVVVFATNRVQQELERQLAEIAARRGIPLADVRKVWNEVFLPRVRFVQISEEVTNDPRVGGVAELHDADAPTAALAVMLAPCVVLTDNRKHFAPLKIPDTRTDQVAVNANELARYYGGMNAMALVPTVTGAMAVEGSRKVISTIGRDAAVVVALLLIGAGVMLWLSDSGSHMRQGAKKLARQIGPPLAEAATRALVLSDEMTALAIDPPSPPDSALRFIAKILATRQTILSTGDIARSLLENDYRFGDTGRHATQTRRWLLEQDCFVEQQRGHWTLGYHAAAR